MLRQAAQSKGLLLSKADIIAINTVGEKTKNPTKSKPHRFLHVVVLVWDFCLLVFRFFLFCIFFFYSYISNQNYLYKECNFCIECCRQITLTEVLTCLGTISTIPWTKIGCKNNLKAIWVILQLLDDYLVQRLMEKVTLLFKLSSDIWNP